jgi:hypothetical protein
LLSALFSWLHGSCKVVLVGVDAYGDTSSRGVVFFGLSSLLPIIDTLIKEKQGRLQCPCEFVWTCFGR